MSGDELCHCLAHMDDEPTSHHTAADHRSDCSGGFPDVCGGCWGCLAATVRYWEARREQ